MRNGAIILSVFAAIWAIMGLHIAGQPQWAQAVPLVLSVALILLAITGNRHVPPRSPEDGKRVGRYRCIPKVRDCCTASQIQPIAVQMLFGTVLMDAAYLRTFPRLMKS
ncbi:hypothetical protein [Asticcacaulis sp. 201]|uniref:hypothetical protein n=1 Tax=Asticcacaulis sp. 201 TaxID=3028787 RepID=UPI00291604D9|nr:hypothetical protein [Asticcacaulis sp. 201]MDV6330007.1 hypothetical protein [Asticcacaulis sp. 201]